MTSRYLIDIENRKSKIIHVYRNGDKYNGAALVLLRPIEQQKLERIFKAIEEKITLPYNKPIKKIYTLKGKEIEDPIYVKDQMYYVVGSSESFINTKYGSIYKWAIIGPVRWSKFADVFYEPPESDDIGQRTAFQWRSTTTNSARLSSKMTKSMSAYPAEQKVPRNSKMMTRSFDQSKRAVSEPSNDKKEESKNRNGETAYFHSPDDKYSSGDNSDGSPKIISTQSQRSMNQFLNDSLKMYQMKDQTNDNMDIDNESRSQKDETISEPEFLTNIDENKLDSDKQNDENISNPDENNSEEKNSDEKIENNDVNIDIDSSRCVHSGEDKQTESDEETVESNLARNKNKLEEECDLSEEDVEQEQKPVVEIDSRTIKFSEKQSSVNEDVNDLPDEIKDTDLKMSNRSDELEEPNIQENETPNDVFTDDKLGFSLDQDLRKEGNDSNLITAGESENENSLKEEDEDHDLSNGNEDQNNDEDELRMKSDYLDNDSKNVDDIQKITENENPTKDEVMETVKGNMYSDKEEEDDISESRDTNKSDESNKIEVVSDLEDENEISEKDENSISSSKPENKTEALLEDKFDHTDFSNDENYIYSKTLEEANQESKDEKLISYEKEENSESDDEDKSTKYTFGNTFDRNTVNSSLNNDQWDKTQYVSQPSTKENNFDDFKDSADSRHSSKGSLEKEALEDPNSELGLINHPNEFSDLSKDKRLSKLDSNSDIDEEQDENDYLKQKSQNNVSFDTKNDKEEDVSEISNPGNEIRESSDDSYIRKPEPNNDETEIKNVKDYSTNDYSEEKVGERRDSYSENDRETEESDHDPESMIEYEKNEHKFKEKEIYDKSLPETYFKTDSDTEDYDDSKVSVIDSTKDEEKKVNRTEENLKSNNEKDEDNCNIDSKAGDEGECNNYEEKLKSSQEEDNDNDVTVPDSDILEDSLAELNNNKDNSELLDENKEMIPKHDLHINIPYSLDEIPNNSIDINNRSIEQYNRVDVKIEEPDHFISDDNKHVADISNNDLKEENAAMIIQKNFRGHLVRKELVDHSKDIDNDESEGEQNRSYDEHDSDENENDPEINYSMMKDATNDLITDEILDEHSPSYNNCPEDIFTLNK